MGSIIIAIVGTILLGLIGAWLRAELSASFEPFVKWVIGKGAARFPKDMRASVEAEILAINAAKTSPTARLWEACDFYMKTGRSVRALQEARSPRSRTRESRRAIYRGMLLMPVVVAGQTILDIQNALDFFASGWQHPALYIGLLFSFLAQICGSLFLWRQIRALLRVRRWIRS